MWVFWKGFKGIWRPFKGPRAQLALAPGGNVVLFFVGPYIPFKGNIGDSFKALLEAILSYFGVF